jgi:hypothetical protein
MVPRAGLDMLEKKKSISSAGIRNPHRPASSLVTTDYVNPVPKNYLKFRAALLN